MSESTYKDDQELFHDEQLLATKQAFIELWISDVPMPELRRATTAHLRRGRRQRSCKSRVMTEEENPAPVRRSKRGSPPEYEPLPEPQRKRRTVAKPRGRGGRVSQLRLTAASNFEQRFDSSTAGTKSFTSSLMRNRTDLEKAVPEIICRQLPDVMAPDMREDVKSLRRELLSAVQRRGILPQSLRDRLHPHLETWDQEDICFSEYPRSKEEESMIWMTIRDIRNDAQQCGEQDSAEADWSHNVVRPLIKYALKYTPWENRTVMHAIKTVAISPDSLLPKDANGAKFKLKKVDFAMFIKPDSSLSNKIKQKLMCLPLEERSINQTSTAVISHLPLIASFELKQQTPGTDPMVQLGIWSSALAEKLRKFQGQGKKESELKALPLVTIVGHYWSVYYSYTTDNGERMLQGPDYLGTTTSLVGIYTIIKAIQIITKYGVEKYMPWFEQHILDPVSSIPLREGSAREGDARGGEEDAGGGEGYAGGGGESLGESEEAARE